MEAARNVEGASHQGEFSEAREQQGGGQSFREAIKKKDCDGGGHVRFTLCALIKVK